MKMLKLLGLTVFVVCIAAFASGCGGGGGGGGSAMTPEEPPPVMECPQGQVGTYPNCTDPGPTDEERIAAAREILADIVAEARSLAQTASLVAAAVGVHPDATAEQMDIALDYAANAQAALADILAASNAGDAATTLAQAQTAVTDAQAALANLAAAQSAAASIQSAVEAVASQREQMVADEAALTNNSSLIKHLRNNEIISKGVLAGTGLTAAVNLIVGDTTTNSASYPVDSMDAGRRIPSSRTVTVQTLTSDSTTLSLNGTGTLSYGFELDNGTPTTDPTTFVNAYTDIQKTRTITGDNPTTRDNVEESYEVPDTDYLLAGIWLTSATSSADADVVAFAYGGQPIASGSSVDYCSVAERSGTSTDGRTISNCDPTTGFHSISSFVDDGKNVMATYQGSANGVYLAAGNTSYFNANVELTAEFINPTGAGTDGRGSIQGAVTNITAGGQSIEGSIELQKPATAFADTLAPFEGTTAGVVGGNPYIGNWKGQFFGLGKGRGVRSQTRSTDTSDPPVTTVTTTYAPAAPGSVAGTFYAIKQSAPAGEAAFIGSFGAHR